MIVSKHWTAEERLNVIHDISARWGNNVHSADKRDLTEAMKIIRNISSLNTETMELNRDMILSFTKDIK